MANPNALSALPSGRNAPPAEVASQTATDASGATLFPGGIGSDFLTCLEPVELMIAAGFDSNILTYLRFIYG